jgi:hypothetical protein
MLLSCLQGAKSMANSPPPAAHFAASDSPLPLASAPDPLTPDPLTAPGVPYQPPTPTTPTTLTLEGEGCLATAAADASERHPSPRSFPAPDRQGFLADPDPHTPTTHHHPPLSQNNASAPPAGEEKETAACASGPLAPPSRSERSENQCEGAPEQWVRVKGCLLTTAGRGRGDNM